MRPVSDEFWIPFSSGRSALRGGMSAQPVRKFFSFPARHPSPAWQTFLIVPPATFLRSPSRLKKTAIPQEARESGRLPLRLRSSPTGSALPRRSYVSDPLRLRSSLPHTRRRAAFLPDGGAGFALLRVSVGGKPRSAEIIAVSGNPSHLLRFALHHPLDFRFPLAVRHPPNVTNARI